MKKSHYLTREKQIYFVGAGPGNVELLTIAGFQAIKKAQIVFYYALIDEKGFRKINPSATWLYVGKRSNQLSTNQKLINRLIVSYLERGLQIVRLKGGDPTIFGRLSEEISELKKKNIPFSVIPGVSAASAAAADLELSLTKREISRSVSFVTPAVSKNSEKTENWAEIVKTSETSVIYMGGKTLKYISSTLLENGLRPTTPVAIVESASLESKKQITSLAKLVTIDTQSFKGPVCIIIGKVIEDVSTNSMSNLESSLDLKRLAFNAA